MTTASSGFTWIHLATTAALFASTRLLEVRVPRLARPSCPMRWPRGIKVVSFFEAQTSKTDNAGPSRDRLHVYPRGERWSPSPNCFSATAGQAVRIHADHRLPDSVKEVEVRACGQERIIAPVGRSWDSFFLNGQDVSDDCLAERAGQVQAEREAF